MYDAYIVSTSFLQSKSKATDALEGYKRVSFVQASTKAVEASTKNAKDRPQTERAESKPPLGKFSRSLNPPVSTRHVLDPLYVAPLKDKSKGNTGSDARHVVSAPPFKAKFLTKSTSTPLMDSKSNKDASRRVASARLHSEPSSSTKQDFQRPSTGQSDVFGCATLAPESKIDPRILSLEPLTSPPPIRLPTPLFHHLAKERSPEELTQEDIEESSLAKTLVKEYFSLTKEVNRSYARHQRLLAELEDNIYAITRLDSAFIENESHHGYATLRNSLKDTRRFERAGRFRFPDEKTVQSRPTV